MSHLGDPEGEPLVELAREVYQMERFPVRARSQGRLCALLCPKEPGEHSRVVHDSVTEWRKWREKQQASKRRRSRNLALFADKA